MGNMRLNKEEFAKVWTKNVYIAMSPQFRKMVRYEDIVSGIDFGVDLSVKDAFELSCYVYNNKPSLPKYCRTLGMIASAAINQFDPMSLAVDIEDMSEDVYEFYWEQMAAMRHFMPFYSKWVETYTIDKMDAIVYANEVILMNFGKQLCAAYKESNCLPNNLPLVTFSYITIGSIINYLWVLSQLEKREEIDKTILENTKEILSND